MRLENKVAIITGGSRGIGHGVAVAFADEGAAVIIVGRNQNTCEETAAFITKKGGNAVGIVADESKEADVTGMVIQTLEKLHRIDLLVNCAAVNLPYRAVTDVSLDDWNWIIGVNLTGIFLCCKGVVPHMKQQHFGKIINFSSIGGLSGAPGRAPYRATKAAIINFSECLAAKSRNSVLMLIPSVHALLKPICYVKRNKRLLSPMSPCRRKKWLQSLCFLLLMKAGVSLAPLLTFLVRGILYFTCLKNRWKFFSF